MTKRTRAVALLLVLVMALLVSCGGEDDAMRATLTDGECTYDGRTTARPGRFVIEIENRTFRFGSFGVVALWPGESVDDIALVRERIASRRLQRSRARSDVPPPFGRWFAGADVEPTTRTSLPVAAEPGRYAVVCYLHRNADDRVRASQIAAPERAYIAAQIVVTSPPPTP